MKNASHNKDVNATGVHESHLAKKNDLKIERSPLLRFSVSLMLSLFIVYTIFQVQTVEAAEEVVQIEEDLLQDDLEYVPHFKEEVVKVEEPEPEPKIKPTIITDKIEEVDNDTEIKKQVLQTETQPKEVSKLVDVGDVDVIDEDDDKDIEVPFAFIEDAPIYPGCEKFKTKKERKKCMSEKIQKLINRKFNTGLAEDLDLNSGLQRINVLFIIDENGNVTGIQSRAPHPKLQKEAERVVKLLPKMQPGKQRNKNVRVKYTLPIIFKID
ncbi:MAG: energy transducer TonB [Bacteroidota bacterium]